MIGNVECGGCNACRRTRLWQTSWTLSGQTVPAIVVCFPKKVVREYGGIKGLIKWFNDKTKSSGGPFLLDQGPVKKCDNPSSFEAK